MGILDTIKNIGKKKDQTKKDKTLKKTEPVKKKESDQKDYKTLAEKTETSQPVLQPKEKTDTKQVARSSKEDTGEAYKVLMRPLITEKATDLSALGKYCFEVSPRANKIQVKKAIKDLYNVDPVSVNIINMRGKRVRYGRIQGKRKNWKKAIIALKPGDKIELYEGV